MCRDQLGMARLGARSCAVLQQVEPLDLRPSQAVDDRHAHFKSW